jgi:hypothetical protein
MLSDVIGVSRAPFGIARTETVSRLQHIFFVQIRCIVCRGIVQRIFLGTEKQFLGAFVDRSRLKPVFNPYFFDRVPRHKRTGFAY